MIKFKILTIFPRYFISPFMEGLLKRAIDNRIIMLETIDIRGFTKDKHKTVDDTPYGGGAGMVMKPDPIVSALEYASDEKGYSIIVFSPKGKKFDQIAAKRFAQHDKFILVCGRYEGIDERVMEFYSDEEISIGDYVLNGGEVSALVFIETVARLAPGFLGNDQSVVDESFENNLLEYPQYTRPRDFRGHTVPDVLFSGNHELIREWRLKQSMNLVKERRSDLLELAKNNEQALDGVKKKNNGGNNG